MHNAYYVYARRKEAENMYIYARPYKAEHKDARQYNANRRDLLVTPGAKQNYCQDHKDSETRYITL